MLVRTCCLTSHKPLIMIIFRSSLICVCAFQEEDKARLVQETGLQLKQINNWFINQRKRNWHSNPSTSNALKSKRKRYFYIKKIVLFIILNLHELCTDLESEISNAGDKSAGRYM